MPKVDPVTGCVVATMSETWQAMAKEEKRDVADMRDEFNEQLDAEERQQEARFYALDVATKLLRGCASDEDPIVEVIEVLDVKVSGTGRSSGVFVSALGYAAGRLVHVSGEQWSDAGSAWSPPDGGAELFLEPIFAPSRFDTVVAQYEEGILSDHEFFYLALSLRPSVSLVAQHKCFTKELREKFLGWVRGVARVKTVLTNEGMMPVPEPMLRAAQAWLNDWIEDFESKMTIGKHRAKP